MRDQFGRKINYMRISVTDRCNYRCVYCMPPEGIEWVPMAEVLTFEEICSICREAASLGITRIKLTGGEPLVRLGVADLVGMLHEIPGIEQVTMTTNGALLSKYLKDLIANHLDAVNISLDTTDPERFSEITRGGQLKDVLEGIRRAKISGIPVKINTVLYAGEDWKEMFRFAKENPIDVRFIEVMPIGKGLDYAGASKEEVLRYMEETYGTPGKDRRTHGNGPAQYYTLPGFTGSIGLITPIHGVFCDKCNRIRLSATGQIKPCLCYGETLDVKNALRNGDCAAVRQILQKAILKKPQAHAFHRAGGVTESRTMVSIGG